LLINYGLIDHWCCSLGWPSYCQCSTTIGSTNRTTRATRMIIIRRWQLFN